MYLLTEFYNNCPVLFWGMMFFIFAPPLAVLLEKIVGRKSH